MTAATNAVESTFKTVVFCQGECMLEVLMFICLVAGISAVLTALVLKV